VRRRDALLAVAGFAAFAPLTARQASAWSALAAGGVAVLLRHAQTEAGVGDPPGYRLDDCATQRNLSAEGRRQAHRIGVALSERRIAIARVLSSRWCRCLDTARLAFPGVAVEPFAALDSFFDDRSAEPERSLAARAAIAAIRPPDNVAFVTHQVNIAALTGLAVGSGEAVLARPAGDGMAVIGKLAL
jgi:broad specificity phosphatase PhoE